jgi:FMNH2-dependent dimethyl sulfone monooxygenase
MDSEHLGEQTGPVVKYTGPGSMKQRDGRPIDEAPVMNDNFSLGPFAFNCSNATSLSSAETSFEPSPDYISEIATSADEFGMELIVPVARWKGQGGNTDVNGQNFETHTWAASLAQQTSYSNIVATCHVPMFHPFVAAKMGTTIDWFSGGRYMLNIVSGWFGPEIEMFGKDPLPHDERYVRSHEWAEVLKLAWSEQGFTFDGDHYTVKEEDDWRGDYTAGGYSRPKPIQQPRPPIMNAGFSDAGRDFSAEHADMLFMSLSDFEQGEEVVNDVRERVAQKGRDPDTVQIMTVGMVYIADDEQEARRKRDALVSDDNADWPGAKNYLDLLGIGSESHGDRFEGSDAAKNFIAGYSGYPVVGTPEQAAEEFAKMQEIGIDGMIFGGLDLLEEVKHLGNDVIPEMEEIGLRNERRGEQI